MKMYFKKQVKIYVGLWVLFFVPFLAEAQESRIISVVGRVTIDGRPAQVGDPVPVGARVETESGASATLAVGDDNVMRVSSESTLRLESLTDGSVNTVLERGRVEGVKQVGFTESTRTVVATESGSMEVTGGRYLIEVPEAGQGEARFLSVDGLSSVQSQQGETLRLEQGEQVRVGQGSTQREQLAPQQVQEQRQPIVNAATPTTPLSRSPASAPAPVAVEPAAPAPPRFSDARPPAASPVNRDPVQNLPGRNPNVRVTFNP